VRFIVLLLAAVTLLGVWETARHRLTRRRIPLRVHVNGSRGKSSVTRLIAAGLQAGGIRTCAKTTGSAARFLHADGTETPVLRHGSPNIREQLGIFRQAAAEGAEALVMECMAVRPDLQRTCERDIVNSTLGVITNVRSDHLEVQGPRLEDVARSLSQTVPARATLFTAEDVFAADLAEAARRRGSACRVADPATVTPADLAPFRYVEFAENVALALDVCVAAGVDRRRALEGMWGVRPDVGALERLRVADPGGELVFANAFAANDPESTARIWRTLGLDAPGSRSVILFNNRADRMRRARDLAPLLGTSIRAGHYVLIGQGTSQLADMMRAVPRELIVDLGGADAAEIWTRTAALCGPGATVVGIGNIGGIGMDVLALLREREVRP
jgi:poly-gamma-glutamate synthase PgsB/CapB